MKTTALLFIAILATTVSTLADSGASIKLIKTKSGKVYTNCRVFKLDPDGVIIAHQLGGAKLLFSDLPDETRALLGYDAGKADAYEKDRAEQKRKDREQAWKLRVEAAKAEAAAYIAEAKRMEIVAVQNLAMGGFGGFGWDGLGWWPGGFNAYGNHGHRHHGVRHGALGKGSTNFLTPHPGSSGIINSKGRTFFAPPQRPTPLATPAMGPLTPGLGAGAR